MNGTQAERGSPLARAIPSRRVPVHDPNHMPSDYSTTPGGTIYSTTPGGTRIIYERKFLLELRNSPLAKSPPANLPVIPGVTCEDNGKPEPEEKPEVTALPGARGEGDGEEPQFQMDI
ncbi:eukaryotic translation initiation factor 4E-binding protein 1 [Nematostella vectensis]|uniref:eukaryotic translation initiation factor 4E-binding protein 1 n=1 Tax=Nematostella vectensis TaxID=45351 RepID=UPI002076E1FB|nr:eukaryotic translation initiation factor 4E-binding protein 1 [Nematostella vectensis]